MGLGALVKIESLWRWCYFCLLLDRLIDYQVGVFSFHLLECILRFIVRIFDETKSSTVSGALIQNHRCDVGPAAFTVVEAHAQILFHCHG